MQCRYVEGPSRSPCQTTVICSAAALTTAAAVVVVSSEGNSVGGAERKRPLLFCEKAIPIARLPSVIDHGISPHRRRAVALKTLDWACAARYKKTADKERSLLWQKGLIRHRD